MTAPDDTHCLGPAVLGACLGVLLGELTACLLPVLGPSLVIVLASAGQGALVAAAAAALVRRVDGGDVLGAVLPGLLAGVGLMSLALLAAGVA